MASTKISLVWDGYCPESKLKGEKIRMRLNDNDFFESEKTGLQAFVFPGLQAVILNFRGEGKFRKTETYADELAAGEILCPQNFHRAPFNKPMQIFETSEELIEYLENSVAPA